MACFWRDLVNCDEDCGGDELPPLMAIYRNTAGEGLPTDVVYLSDALSNWCVGDYSSVTGILSGHVVLVSAFAGCPLIGAPVNDGATPPDTCDAATLIAFLQTAAVDTEFDVGAIPYSPTWTNADLGLSAPGFGVYRVDTDVGVRLLIVIAHTCY